jgi:hypothetical protein
MDQFRHLLSSLTSSTLVITIVITNIIIIACCCCWSVDIYICVYNYIYIHIHNSIYSFMSVVEHLPKPVPSWLVQHQSVIWLLGTSSLPLDESLHILIRSMSFFLESKVNRWRIFTTMDPFYVKRGQFVHSMNDHVCVAHAAPSFIGTNPLQGALSHMLHP